MSHATRESLKHVLSNEVHDTPVQQLPAGEAPSFDIQTRINMARRRIEKASPGRTRPTHQTGSFGPAGPASSNADGRRLQALASSATREARDAAIRTQLKRLAMPSRLSDPRRGSGSRDAQYASTAHARTMLDPGSPARGDEAVPAVLRDKGERSEALFSKVLFSKVTALLDEPKPTSSRTGLAIRHTASARAARAEARSNGNTWTDARNGIDGPSSQGLRVTPRVHSPARPDEVRRRKQHAVLRRSEVADALVRPGSMARAALLFSRAMLPGDAMTASVLAMSNPATAGPRQFCAGIKAATEFRAARDAKKLEETLLQERHRRPVFRRQPTVFTREHGWRHQLSPEHHHNSSGSPDASRHSVSDHHQVGVEQDSTRDLRSHDDARSDLTYDTDDNDVEPPPMPKRNIDTGDNTTLNSH